MARRGKKFFQVWFFLVLAALAVPFQQFLAAKQYEHADDFFQDLLVWVVLGSILLTPPFLIFLYFRRKRRKKNASLDLDKQSLSSTRSKRGRRHD